MTRKLTLKQFQSNNEAPGSLAAPHKQGDSSNFRVNNGLATKFAQQASLGNGASQHYHGVGGGPAFTHSEVEPYWQNGPHQGPGYGGPYEPRADPYGAAPYGHLPPPPPPPPAGGSYGYYRDALPPPPPMHDMHLPPPPPSGGVSSYGYLRANPPLELARLDLPPPPPSRDYGHPPYPYPPPPSSYGHAPMAMDVMYGMPPPPPPPPRAAAANVPPQRPAAEVQPAAAQPVAVGGRGKGKTSRLVSSDTPQEAPDAKPKSGRRSGAAAAGAAAAAAGPAGEVPVARRKGSEAAGDVAKQPAVPSPAKAPVADTPAVAVEAKPEEPPQEQAETKPVCTEVPLVSEAPAPPPVKAVKNDYADRLAQQALARLATRASAKAASPAKPPSINTIAVDTSNKPAVQAAQPAAAPSPPPSEKSDGGVLLSRQSLASVDPASQLTSSPDGSVVAVDVTSNSDAAGERDARGGGGVGGERPRLKLQPRTLPVDALAGGAEAEGRRKLQLQARTKDTAAADDRGARPPTASTNATAKASSIFGAARPREEILKERGVDVQTREWELDVSATRATAHHGYGSDRVSRTASVTSGLSGEDYGRGGGDDWKKVTRTRNMHRDDLPLAPAHSYDGDPLLSAYAAAPRGGRYHNEGGYNSGWGYNDHGPRGHGRNAEPEDDGLVIRRSLPLRSDF